MKKREATIKEGGSHWAELAKSLRSTQRAHNTIVQESDVSNSKKKIWRKFSKNHYEDALKLILKLAENEKMSKTP